MWEKREWEQDWEEEEWKEREKEFKLPKFLLTKEEAGTQLWSYQDSSVCGCFMPVREVKTTAYLTQFEHIASLLKVENVASPQFDIWGPVSENVPNTISQNAGKSHLKFCLV